MKARTTFCPHCGKKGRRSLIDLTPPCLCLVCGYSMIKRSCTDYRKNIVMPLAERKNETAPTMLSTPTRVRHLLEMRRSGLIDLRGELTQKGRELVEKARDTS